MFRRGAARVSPDPWGLPADDDNYQLEDVQPHPPPPPTLKATAATKDTVPILPPPSPPQKRQVTPVTSPAIPPPPSPERNNNNVRQNSAVIVVKPVEKPKEEFVYKKNEKHPEIVTSTNKELDQYVDRKFNQNHAWTPYLHERKREMLMKGPMKSSKGFKYSMKSKWNSFKISWREATTLSNFKETVLAKENSKQGVYCNTVFAAFDYMVDEDEAVKLKQKSIYNGLVFTTDPNVADNYHSLVILLVEFLPSIVIGLLNGMYPVIFGILLSALYFTVPPEKPYQASNMNPSPMCGPFRIYDKPSDIIDVQIGNAATWFNTIWTITTSSAVVSAVIILLILMVYYCSALNSAHKDLSDMMKEQLVLEGKDKQFLLARINELGGAPPKKKPPPAQHKKATMQTVNEKQPMRNGDVVMENQEVNLYGREKSVISMPANDAPPPADYNYNSNNVTRHEGPSQVSTRNVEVTPTSPQPESKSAMDDCEF
ncbi:hypothetical protein MAR_028713 [Mya arenaria]|uniref:Uncharacterized protein n=1 Tax=Mya arenaria TaxID=6604 RepID=A0ABY7DGG6_MYAAR|nr:hypothetical protein MAR_028713 [Mya arenaria]